MLLIPATILAYLLGSIPTGYILTQALKGIDIREQGSGNFGATNVYRVVNPAAGIVVLILDIAKGLIPVILFGDFILARQPGLDPVLLCLILGVAAICGHNWTIFLRFKGGKGVATTAGVLLGLSLKIPSLGLIAGLSLGVWVLVVAISGFISLGSIIAACSLPVFMVVFDQPLNLTIFAAALCLFVIFRHKSNIRRLLRGEEGKIFHSR